MTLASPHRATALALALIAVPCCQEQPAPKAEVIRPIRTQVVEPDEGTRTRTFSGTIQAGTEAKLSFRVNGSVEKLHVKMGEQVKKGQLIAELDPTDFKLQINEVRALAQNASAQARNAKATYDRTRSLYESKNASHAQLDLARAAAESASAQQGSIDQRLGLLRTQLGYTKLTAPSDGAIALVAVEQNENVQAGMPVVMLNAGGDLEVAVTIPEALIGAIEQGSTVKVKLSALDGRIVPAVVTEISVAAGAETTFPVRARLVDPDPAIRPGMAAEVEIGFGRPTDKPRIVVPTVAVGEDRAGRFVFVLTEVREDVGVIRRIEVGVKEGEITERGLEITEGLQGGELVVTAGLRHVQDGFKARLWKKQQ